MTYSYPPLFHFSQVSKSSGRAARDTAYPPPHTGRHALKSQRHAGRHQNSGRAGRDAAHPPTRFCKASLTSSAPRLPSSLKAEVAQDAIQLILHHIVETPSRSSRLPGWTGLWNAVAVKK
jgi:hypothetical protein